jgi:uncharacterized protein (DUF58 family)
MSNLQQIFSLTDLEALKALQIYVKHLVDGLLTGMHQSPKKGFGIEFKEYKNYTPGDSLKQLDWKYFAKTDHYMIKEAEVERQNDFVFVLDRSESMNFEGENASKFNIGKAFIASIAYLAQQQHDNYRIFNIKINARNYESFLFELIKTTTNPLIQFEEMLPKQLQSAKSTVFLLTDAYLADEELDKLLRDWSLSTQKLVLVHLLYSSEMTLDFKKRNYRFKDLETGKTLQINTKEALVTYKEQLNLWHSNIKKLCANKGIIYFQIDAGQPLRNDIIHLLNLMNFTLK